MRRINRLIASPLSVIAGRCLVPALAVCLVAGALVPSAAGASMTVGQLVTPNQACAGTFTYLQAAVSSGNSYTVPSDGVITAWHVISDATLIANLKFKVGRATGGNNFEIVGETPASPQMANAVTDTPARIAVKAGEVIGLSRTGGDCLSNTGSAGDIYRFTNSDVAAGTSASFGASPNARLPITATVEPDADGDGFGDETQDGCSTDPTTHDACQADLSVTETANPSTVALGDLVTYTATVTNNSPFNVARAVSVSDPLSAGMTFVSASGGTCVGATCAVGDLAAGASATVTFVARASGTGVQSDTAVVSSATGDPSPANNAASAQTFVLAPFSGIQLRSQTLAVKNGRIQVSMTCPAGSVGNCVGTDTLTTDGKVVPPRAVAVSKKAKILTLGKRGFSIPAGKTSKVTIKLNTIARRLLAKTRTLKARQKVVAHDSRGTNKTSTGTLTLKLARAKH